MLVTRFLQERKKWLRCDNSFIIYMFLRKEKGVKKEFFISVFLLGSNFYTFIFLWTSLIMYIHGLEWAVHRPFSFSINHTPCLSSLPIYSVFRCPLCLSRQEGNATTVSREVIIVNVKKVTFLFRLVITLLRYVGAHFTYAHTPSKRHNNINDGFQQAIRRKCINVTQSVSLLDTKNEYNKN